MPATSSTATFRSWRRQRPFVGCLLLLLAGVEMFFSTQLDLGNMHVQLGVEGFQATIIPIGFVLLAVLIATMPQHRIFYGVIALALSIYSIIGVNLGGFLIGMLLSAVGGILAVSWAPAGQPAVAPVAQHAAPQHAAQHAAPHAAQQPTAETADRELVGALAAHDGAVHAEFVPYPALVARRPAGAAGTASADTRSTDTASAPPPFPQATTTAPRGRARGSQASASGTRPGTAAAVLLLFVAALTGVGAAEAPEVQAAALARTAPAAAPGALCIPILMTCSSPSPSPSPSSGSGGGVVGGLVGGLVGGVKVPGAPGTPAPLVIGPDDSAYRMTLPAGQLGGSSISISGIHQVGLVTVKKVDGTSFAVIKLKADDVVITGFLLDVRRATGPALVSTADRMELKGNVSVWLDSLTGTTLGGLGLTLGTDQTPPPSSELPPRLLRVNLGLVATSADSITYVNLHQELHG